MLCSALVCARFSRAGSPSVVERGKSMVLLLGIGPPFVNLGVFPSGTRIAALLQWPVSLPPDDASCSFGWGPALATVAA